MRIQRTREVLKEYEKLEHEYNKEDPYGGWLYQPHTITALLILLVLMVYTSFRRDYLESFHLESNFKVGIIAAVAFWLFFAAIQFKDGLFVRPHPIVWRVIMGASVLYLCLLSFTFFQKVEDVRAFLQVLDPKLGVPLPERSYADHCELFTPNETSSFKYLYEAINDEFMLAHFLGWFGKALLFRDHYLCWALSILFEILEISLEHLLPNFKECWWDHVILDILVCNFFGFLLGLKVADYFSMKDYAWMRKKTGVNVESFNWEVFTSWKRLAAVIALMTVVSLVELNAFFLKYVLWIPPPHPINVARLFLWWGLGIPGVREYYQWISDKNCKKLGPMAWISIAVCGMEILVWVKFGKGMFPNPTPEPILYSWIGFAAVFALWAIWFYGIRRRPNNKVAVNKPKQK